MLARIAVRLKIPNMRILFSHGEKVWQEQTCPAIIRYAVTRSVAWGESASEGTVM